MTENVSPTATTRVSKTGCDVLCPTGNLYCKAMNGCSVFNLTFLIPLLLLCLICPALVALCIIVKMGKTKQTIKCVYCISCGLWCKMACCFVGLITKKKVKTEKTEKSKKTKKSKAKKVSSKKKSGGKEYQQSVPDSSVDVDRSDGHDESRIFEEKEAKIIKISKPNFKLEKSVLKQE